MKDHLLKNKLYNFVKLLNKLSFVLFIIFYFFLSNHKIFSQRLAKYEPQNGVYIGAFIQNDLNVNGSIPKFENLVWKKHAGYLTYTSVSSPFPSDYADSCRKYGAFVQIGLEPDTAFRDVFDGPHLRNWARDAARAAIPIFLRFASEMNGDWVPWFGYPSVYKEKWKLVYNIMKEEAPNVVMVWCPNWRPDLPNDSSRNILAYYPGDQYVDWVGVNFYMWGPIYDSLMNETGLSPLQKISSVYNQFPNKPIMICEWGAASKEWRGNPPLPKITTDYSINNMQLVYNNLQNIFPRIKGIFWFDYNSSQINKSDFSITSDSLVLNTYRNVIQNPYYITQVHLNVPFVEIEDKVIRGIDTIDFTIQCSQQINKIQLLIDGELVLTQEYFSNKIIYNFLSYADGPHEIEVRAMTIDSLEGRGFKTLEIDNNNDYLNLIFDNLSEDFFAFGGWLSSSQPDRYGPNYYVLPPNSSGFAKWRVNLPEGTKVKIYAMWSEHANRSSQARYVIKTNLSDSTLIVMNQRINGGKWNYLTEINTINNSSVEIILYPSPDGYVIADAIRYYRNSLSSVSSPEKNISEFYLYQNYPNPFNLKTKIAFFLFKKMEVKFLIYNTIGQKIYESDLGTLKEGDYEFEFLGNGFPSGLYIYVLFIKDIISGEVKLIKKKMILMK